MSATRNRQEKPSADWRTLGLGQEQAWPSRGPPEARARGEPLPGDTGRVSCQEAAGTDAAAGPSELTRGEAEASFHQAFNYSDHAVLGLIASERAGLSFTPLSSSSDRLLGADPGPCLAQGTLTSLPAGAPDVVTHRTEAQLVPFPRCTFHSLNGDRRGKGGWKWHFKQAPRTCGRQSGRPTAQVCL